MVPYLQKPLTVTQHPVQAFRIPTGAPTVALNTTTPLASLPTSLHPQPFPPL